MAKSHVLKALFALVALVLVAGACGDDDTAETTAAIEGPLTLPADCISTFAPQQDSDEDMDLGEDGAMVMNMGNRCETPASEAGGELVAASFQLLETRPADDYENAVGRAELARTEQGTTVTIAFSGLKPNTNYIAHVHADVCANNGGDHFQFEEGGDILPPNEIHLAFTSEASGNGFMTANNHGVVDDRAKAVVVHPADLLDNKVACAEF